MTDIAANDLVISLGPDADETLVIGTKRGGEVSLLAEREGPARATISGGLADD